jgi:hypothetical protein
MTRFTRVTASLLMTGALMTGVVGSAFAESGTTTSPKAEQQGQKQSIGQWLTEARDLLKQEREAGKALRTKVTQIRDLVKQARTAKNEAALTNAKAAYAELKESAKTLKADNEQRKQLMQAIKVARQNKDEAATQAGIASLKVSIQTQTTAIAAASVKADALIATLGAQ